MVHEQKVTSFLSSTCQVSVERRVLELESECLSSIPTRRNIVLLNILFSRSKTSDANVVIIASVVCFWKLRIQPVYVLFQKIICPQNPIQTMTCVSRHNKAITSIHHKFTLSSRKDFIVYIRNLFEGNIFSHARLSFCSHGVPSEHVRTGLCGRRRSMSFGSPKCPCGRKRGSCSWERW